MTEDATMLLTHTADTLENWKVKMEHECFIESRNLVTQAPGCFEIESGPLKGTFLARWTQQGGTEFQSKFSHPRPDPETGKVAKYKTPYGVSPEIYTPAVAHEVWVRIAKRQGLAPDAIYTWAAANGKATPVGTPRYDHRIPYFWEWAASCGLPLYITEGAKKANSLMAAGYLATAVAGVYNGHRVVREKTVKVSATLVPNLAKLIQADRQVFLVFDQDESATTRAAVSAALKELAGVLTDAGAKVTRLQWDLAAHPAKGVDDLIALRGGDIIASLRKQRLAGGFLGAIKGQRADKVAAWKAKQDEPVHAWHSIQNAAPGIPTFTGSGRYIDRADSVKFADAAIAGTGRVHVVDAPMGVGKTSTVCKDLVERFRLKHRANPADGAIIYIAPRLTILAQAAHTLGLTKHDPLNVKGIREVCVTVESLHAYAPLWGAAKHLLVICDEWSQALNQLHAGATGTRGVTAQRAHLNDLMRAVAAKGSLVVSEDGVTAHDTHATGLPVGQVLNFSRSPVNRKVYLAKGKAAIAQAIIDKLASGENICHVSDSNRLCRGLAKLLVDGGYVPANQVLVIDSQADGLVRDAFMRNPMGYVKSHGVRFLACSPSAQSGVSLDDGNRYFGALTFSLSHLPYRSARQLLGRLRSDVDMIGYCAHHGVTFLQAGARLSKLAMPEAILKAAVEDVLETRKLAGYLGQEKDAVLQTTLGTIWDPSSAAWSLNAAIAVSRALTAYGQHNLQAKITADLQDKGCDILKWDRKPEAEVVDLVDAVFGTRDSELDTTLTDGSLSESEAAERAALDTEGMTFSQALDTKSASDATHLDRLKASKVIAVHNFRNLAAAGRFDSVEGQLALHRDKFLTKTEILHLIDSGTISGAAHQGLISMLSATQTAPATPEEAVAHIFSLPKKARKAALFQAVGIARVYQHPQGGAFTWSEAGPDDEGLLADIHARALSLAAPIHSVLRLQILEEHSPTSTVNKLLRQLGFRIASERPAGVGVRVRRYRIADLDDADRILALQDYAESAERSFFSTVVTEDARRWVRDVIKEFIYRNDKPFITAVDEDKQLVSADVYREIDKYRPWESSEPLVRFGPMLYEKHLKFTSQVALSQKLAEF